MQRPTRDEAVGRLRDLCLSLPGVSEKLSHAEPTWFVKKSFAMFADHHHDERLAFWCAAPEGMQEALVASEPERFFRPPYVGVRGWLGVYLDVPVDWEEIADIVTEAYRCVAPPKLVARLEALSRNAQASYGPLAGVGAEPQVRTDEASA
jgi:hypothetical protein